MPTSSPSSNKFLKVSSKKYPNVTIRKTPVHPKDESLFSGHYFINKYGSRKPIESKSAEPPSAKRILTEDRSVGVSSGKLSVRKKTRIPVKISNTFPVSRVNRNSVSDVKPKILQNTPTFKKTSKNKENGEFLRAIAELKRLERCLDQERKKCRLMEEKNAVLVDEITELKHIVREKKLSEMKLQARNSDLQRSCEIERKKYLSAQMDNDQLMYRLRYLSNNKCSANRTLGATPSSPFVQNFRTGPAISVNFIDDISKALKFDQNDLESPIAVSTCKRKRIVSDIDEPISKR